MFVKKVYTKEEQKIVDEKKKRYWQTENLLPSVQRGFPYWREAEGQLRYLCFIVAGGVPSEIDRLYKECSLYDIYYNLMLIKVRDFEEL